MADTTKLDTEIARTSDLYGRGTAIIVNQKAALDAAQGVLDGVVAERDAAMAERDAAVAQLATVDPMTNRLTTSSDSFAAVVTAHEAPPPPVAAKSKKG